jgi:23S rRNA (guanosine2251-2'-O)-methyltransferase
VDRNKLNGLTGGESHQGVIAYVSPYEYSDLETLVDGAKERGDRMLFIILDEINDPHNLGSIIRSACAVGATGVIIPKRRSVAMSSVVAKSSAGAAEYVPLCRVTNIPTTIDYLKENGIWIYGADADGTSVYYDADLKGNVALVIGGEGSGMGRLVKEKCDVILSIPMAGKINSLNASVAAGVLMYEVMRQNG